jgi:hypothetical protein
LSSDRAYPFGKLILTGLLASALALAGAAGTPARAAAQCDPASPTCSLVTPDGKGIVGLGLIGAELGFVIPALVQNAMGTDEWWPYLVFPALGAVGGAVGGYFLEQETQGSPEVAVVLLAIGLAAVVPTVVGTLSLTAYDPGRDTQMRDRGEDAAYDDETTTEAIRDEGAEEAPGATSAVQPSALSRMLAGGPGLLRFDGTAGQLLVGVPMVHSRPTFTAAEREALRLAPSADVHVPLVSATF